MAMFGNARKSTDSALRVDVIYLYGVYLTLFLAHNVFGFGNKNIMKVKAITIRCLPKWSSMRNSREGLYGENLLIRIKSLWLMLCGRDD